MDLLLSKSHFCYSCLNAFPSLVNFHPPDDITRECSSPARTYFSRYIVCRVCRELGLLDLSNRYSASNVANLVITPTVYVVIDVVFLDVCLSMRMTVISLKKLVEKLVVHPLQNNFFFWRTGERTLVRSRFVRLGPTTMSQRKNSWRSFLVHLRVRIRLDAVSWWCRGHAHGCGQMYIFVESGGAELFLMDRGAFSADF